MNEEQKEIEELKNRINLIETFYYEKNVIKRIKIYYKNIKEKIKNANCRNNRKNDTSGNNTIYNDNISNAWNDAINKILNNKEIKGNEK